MKTSKKVILASIVTALIAALGFYLILPAINVYSQEFWIMLTFLVVIWGVIYFIVGSGSAIKNLGKVGSKSAFSFKSGPIKWIAIAAAVPVVVLLVGNIASSTFLNAQKYANIIEVPEAVFEEDMPESDTVSNIALMDSASATILGNRKMGELSAYVSQYEVGSSYSQINLGGKPAKVTNLEYGDFFKWFNNRDQGIPGYINVNPVDPEAQYVEFENHMKYVDSAYFNDDLLRKLRFSYPTKIFDEITFEIDEQGNPYYIVSCLAPRVGLFGAMDVNEVIIFNPVDGSSQKYSVSDTPSWVDNVFTGYLAAQKYDWYGMLKNGFWNSVIGNKDCKITTDDFGYIVIEDDVWYFTGVTSVGNDESNIGFIISNARTGEYKYYPVYGAEEYSAMGAAEGEVQEMRYVASFPSLINVSGEATYIMVLKDDNGIVKLYALVNVENYSLVATGNNQTEAKQAYIKLLKEKGVIVDNGQPEQPTQPEALSADIVVSDIRTVTLEGTSVLYITDENGVLYKQSVSADESIMLIKKGDSITVKYHDTSIGGIKQIASWANKG